MTVPPPLDVEAIVELLASLAAVPSEGGDYSELEHALQCAAELAHRAPGDIELQVAGLVHDVGHAFGDDESHGRLGGRAVKPALGERVGQLVEAHVPAKRYLISTETGYDGALSPESTASLVAQGGVLTADELAAFRSQPDSAAAVVLRRADDAAKVPGRKVPGLDHWLPVLHEVATSRSDPTA